MTSAFKRNGSLELNKSNSCTPLPHTAYQNSSKLACPFDLISKFKIYPRYKVLELYALYRSILQYS
jgi:hypothetical protein